MKNTPTIKPEVPYIINVPLSEGEVTVITSDNAQASLEHSARFANGVRETGVSVLAINCGMSDKRFRSHYFDVIGNSMYSGDAKIIIHSSECGDLINEAEGIEQFIAETGTGVVILYGWEFAAKGHNKKEATIYYIREIMKKLEVAVIIYCQKANKPVAGSFDRAGIGMLSFLATYVVKADASEALEKVVEKQVPKVRQRNHNTYIGANITQLVYSKINDLERDGAPGTVIGVLEELLAESKAREITKRKNIKEIMVTEPAESVVENAGVPRLADKGEGIDGVERKILFLEADQLDLQEAELALAA